MLPFRANTRANCWFYGLEVNPHTYGLSRDELHEVLLERSPAFLKAYLAFQSAPSQSGELPQKLCEFVYIAIDISVNHMYERGDFRGLKYVVTGGGGAPLYRVNRARPSQLAFQPVHHYVRIDVEGKRLAMTVVRPSGDVLERCGFEQGGPWECERAAPIDPGEEPGRPWWFWALVGQGLHARLSAFTAFKRNLRGLL